MPENYTIKQVEEKIVAALKAGMPQLRQCRTYQGDFERERDELLLLPPSVLVVFSKRSSKSLSTYGHAHMRTFAFRLLLLARNMSGQGDARDDIYSMIEDCDSVLLDQKLGMDTPTPFIGGDTEMILSLADLSVFSCDYSIDVYKTGA